MESVIRVLIVDDSAYIRKIITQMLSRSPFIEVVGTARSGQEALEQTEQINPDLILLDLMMPDMDGITFLHTQMARRPVPVIIVSIAQETSEMVLQALDAGAVDFVQKPTALATEKIFEISDELIAKIKAVAKTSLSAMKRTPAKPLVLAPEQVEARHSSRFDLIVIGISTGGPQALKYVLGQLPANFPLPIVTVIHMPIGYTDMYAQSLNAHTAMSVSEAKEGEPLRKGHVLIAPAGRHLLLRRQQADRVVVHLDAQPFDNLYRPSVDVLFRSAAEIYKERALGIVMTGMGNDGQHGAAWIKAHGGTIWTESEETSIVYGMPRAVVEAGLSDRRIALTQLAQSLIEVL
jgi:two-component system chemotaxis response regulator CheB